MLSGDIYPATQHGKLANRVSPILATLSANTRVVEHYAMLARDNQVRQVQQDRPGPGRQPKPRDRGAVRADGGRNGRDRRGDDPRQRADRGGTAWVRVTPKWFAAWCARRDTAPRPQPELARLAVGVYYVKPAAAARWLASVFGFESPDPLPDGPDLLRHASLRWAVIPFSGSGMARTRRPSDLATPASCTGRADQTGITGGATRPGPGRQIVSQDSTKRRQPIRKSGRDPGRRPYAPIASKPGKQGDKPAGISLPIRVHVADHQGAGSSST
jgi:hypothetical protein